MTHGGLKHFTSQRPRAPPWSPRPRTHPRCCGEGQGSRGQGRPAPLDSVQAGFPSRRSLRTHRPKVTTLTQESPRDVKWMLRPQRANSTGISPQVSSCRRTRTRARQGQVCTPGPDASAAVRSGPGQPATVLLVTLGPSVPRQAPGLESQSMHWSPGLPSVL